MRVLLTLSSLLTLLALGCYSIQPPSSVDAYIGKYAAMPTNAKLEPNLAAFLVLRPNQDAIEIRYDSMSGTVDIKHEKWYLSRGTGQNVVIGKYAYSVSYADSRIRLIANEVGQYYEKLN